jgi:nucleotide-binding universal stress UspA family protein
MQSMIALKTVLVPTDFSETSAVALRYGKALAEAFGASLHVLHVVQEPFAQPWAVEAYGFSLANLQEEWVREAKTRMAETLTADERAKFTAQLTTHLGHPVVEILKYATDQQIDLIVLGVRGRGPLNQIMMGSVAERVVRKAPCPVLTVRHPEREFVTADA